MSEASAPPPDRMRPEERPVRFVTIPGVPYTGSTLLAFLLNAQPRCVSLGPICGPYWSRGARLDGYRCSCGELLLECPLWQRVLARMQEMGFPFEINETRWATRIDGSDRRLLDILLVRSLRNDLLNAVRDALVAPWPPLRRRQAEAAAYNWAFARAALDVTGRQVFVDSSRDPLRTRVLASAPGIDLWAIHLVRDVRGNAASWIKHFGRHEPRRAAAVWRRANLETERVRRCVSPDRWLMIRYSDLCADVQATMDRVADFLGVERAPVPEDFRALDHHLLGNEMRLEGSGAVREDTSWRDRLRTEDLEVIARVAGPLSRRFGFDWPPGA